MVNLAARPAESPQFDRFFTSIDIVGTGGIDFEGKLRRRRKMGRRKRAFAGKKSGLGGGFHD
jgi:hypothetical protein